VLLIDGMMMVFGRVRGKGKGLAGKPFPLLNHSNIQQRQLECSTLTFPVTPNHG
jgi:hypothetical protein